MKTLAIVLVVVTSAAHAQYKCTAPNGGVTYQQAACPITQKQQILNARAAPPDAAALPTGASSSTAPRKSTDERIPSTVQRDRRSKELEQSVANIEADLERLKVVRTDLDAARKLVAK